MTCLFGSKLNAYHDDELPPDQRQELERHLGVCEECRGELRALRAMSRFFSESPIPELSSAALRRLRSVVPEEKSVLRIAEILTTAAAAVFIVGLSGLFRPAPSSTTPTQTAWAPWMEVASGKEMEPDPLAVAAVVYSNEESSPVFRNP